MLAHTASAYQNKTNEQKQEQGRGSAGRGGIERDSIHGKNTRKVMRNRR